MFRRARRRQAESVKRETGITNCKGVLRGACFVIRFKNIVYVVALALVDQMDTWAIRFDENEDEVLDDLLNDHLDIAWQFLFVAALEPSERHSSAWTP